MGIGPINMGSRSAVFLDRDGVLNRPLVRDGKPYPPGRLEEFELLPGVHEAIFNLRQMGLVLYVVTNQPDVARGAQQRSTVEAMHDLLRRELLLEHFYVCYHDDADNCICRKPKPGLLLKAASEHGLSLADSYMIGDRWRDVDCGHAAGCTTLFIDLGYDEALRSRPHHRVFSLSGAVDLISSLQAPQDR